MARLGLVALLFFLVQWESLAFKEFQNSSDSVFTDMDSLGATYYKAWSFEEGFQESYLSSDQYAYEEIQSEKNWLQRARVWFKNAWESLLNSIWEGVLLSDFWKVFFQIAPYIILLVLMILLVWLGMKFSSNDSKDRLINLTNLSSEEILIKNEDLRALSEAAIKNQDFRLAVRYRYLQVLRLLIDRKLILWKSSKTNYDYQRELRESNFLGPFTEVTRIYNFVWYGNLELDAKTYEELEQAFDNLDQLS